MHVLFVLGEFPLLSQTFVLDQVTGLIDRGHQVSIVAEPPTHPEQAHAAFHQYALEQRTTYFPQNAGQSWQAKPRLWHWLRESPSGCLRGALYSLRRDVTGARGLGPLERAAAAHEAGAFDVILAHFGPNGLRALAMRRLLGAHAPLATVFHGYDLSVWPRQRGAHRYHPLFAEGELMLPISELFRERLIGFGCPAQKISVQRMGVDLESLPFRPRPASKAAPFEVLSIGRLVEKKGFADALRALASPQLKEAPFRYHLVGDGPLRAELEGLTRTLKLTERVVFHGSLLRQQVSGLRDAADLMLVPSVTAANGDQEGLPVALMEAMAAGLPVIATRHSGIPELVLDDDTGLLVPERDPEALAGAIHRMLVDPALRERLALAARERVAERHSLATLNAELEAHLQALVAR